MDLEPIDKVEIDDIVKEINALLDKGFSDMEILNAINHSVENLYSYFRGKKPKSRNLLTSNEFYYSDVLRVKPMTPISDYDYDTGNLETKDFVYSLEMKASFTMDDLVNYLKSKKGLFFYIPKEVKRLQGSLNYLIELFGIDTVVYLIDYANDLYSSNKYIPTENILDIKKFCKKASDALEYKKDLAIDAEVNKIEYKRRLYADRNGIRIYEP